MQLIPMLLVSAIGGVGCGLIVTALLLVRRHGGWLLAMKPDESGRLPVPRRLMLVGAFMAMVLVLVVFVPGMVPWSDSSAYNGRGQRVVFGLHGGLSSASEPFSPGSNRSAETTGD